MPAFVELVVMDEFRIRPLGPNPRALKELIRKGAHGNRDGDAFGTEIRELILPIETGRRNRSVCQPGGGDQIFRRGGEKVALLHGRLGVGNHTGGMLLHGAAPVCRDS